VKVCRPYLSCSSGYSEDGFVVISDVVFHFRVYLPTPDSEDCFVKPMSSARYLVESPPRLRHVVYEAVTNLPQMPCNFPFVSLRMLVVLYSHKIRTKTFFFVNMCSMRDNS
jgi:hypothetical protein